MEKHEFSNLVTGYLLFSPYYEFSIPHMRIYYNLTFYDVGIYSEKELIMETLDNLYVTFTHKYAKTNHYFLEAEIYEFSVNLIKYLYTNLNKLSKTREEFLIFKSLATFKYYIYQYMDQFITSLNLEKDKESITKWNTMNILSRAFNILFIYFSKKPKISCEELIKRFYKYKL